MRGSTTSFHRAVTKLAAGDGPAADGVDAGADLVGGRLRQRRAAASVAQFGVDDPVRLAGPVAPGSDQAVEFLAQRGEGLAAHRGAAEGPAGLMLAWRSRRGLGGPLGQTTPAAVRAASWAS